MFSYAIFREFRRNERSCDIAIFGLMKLDLKKAEMGSVEVDYYLQ